MNTIYKQIFIGYDIVISKKLCGSQLFFETSSWPKPNSFTFSTPNEILEMNGINADMSQEGQDGLEDLDNLPHNLARYARSSYSKKVFVIY